MGEIEKDAVIAALMHGGIVDVLRGNDPSLNDADYQHALGISADDIRSYLASHPEEADRYLEVWSDYAGRHDMLAIIPKADSYQIASIDHGRAKVIRSELDRTAAIIEHLIEIHSLQHLRKG